MQGIVSTGCSRFRAPKDQLVGSGRAGPGGSNPGQYLYAAYAYKDSQIRSTSSLSCIVYHAGICGVITLNVSWSSRDTGFVHQHCLAPEADGWSMGAGADGS